MKQIKTIIFMILGSIFLLLGVIGLLLPILPTTPFLLLSLSCYLRSSKTAYRFVMTNRILGKYIYQYKIVKALPIKSKITAFCGLWIAILGSILFVPIFWVKILLFIIALCVTIHIASIKTMTKEEEQHFEKDYDDFINERGSYN